jgi:prepilin-type processing-associated H-X9-DG protein
VRVLQCPAHPLAGQIPDCYASNGFAFVDDEAPPGPYATRYSQLGLVRNPSFVIYIVDLADRFIPPGLGFEPDLVWDVADHEAASWGNISIRNWPIRVAHMRHGRDVNSLMFDGSVVSMTNEHHELKRWDDGRRGLVGRVLVDQSLPNPPADPPER